MLRDYSSQKEESLIQLSKKCREKGFLNKAWDFCGDMCTRFAVSIDILKVDNAIFDFDGDLEAYQACIIDAENMKKGEIRKIFQDCRDADSSYGDKFQFSGESFDTIAARLSDLADGINPNMNVLTTKAMTSMGKQIDKDMEAIRKDTKERMDKEISDLEKLILKDTAKNLGKNILGMASSVASFAGAVATGKMTKAIDSMYSAAGSFMGICYDAGALGGIGLSSLFGLSDKDYSAGRLEVLGKAEKMKDVSSLSDVAAHEWEEDPNAGYWHTTYEVCSMAETVQGVYSVVSGVTGIADAYHDDGILGVLTNQLPKRSGKDDTGVEGKIKDIKAGLKMGKYAYDFFCDMHEGVLPESIIEGTNTGGVASDMADLFESTVEWIDKTTESSDVFSDMAHEKAQKVVETVIESSEELWEQMIKPRSPDTLGTLIMNDEDFLEKGRIPWEHSRKYPNPFRRNVDILSQIYIL